MSRNEGRPAPVPTKTASTPEQLVDRDRGLADDAVEPSSTPRLEHVLDLGGDDRLGQAELGDAVGEDAAGLVQRLEDRDRVAASAPGRRRRQAGRAGADHGDAAAVGRPPLPAWFSPFSPTSASVALERGRSRPRLPFMPRMQVSSHWVSCGQTRPQMAGQAGLALSVPCRLGEVAPPRSRSTKPGMSMPPGSPSMHMGFLHCEAALGLGRPPRRGESPRSTSSKLRTRRSAGSCSAHRLLFHHRPCRARLSSTSCARPAHPLRAEVARLPRPRSSRAARAARPSRRRGRRTRGRRRRRTSSRRPRYAAGAAHARAVDHDRVQADDGPDAERPGHVARELHHDRRADPIQTRSISSGSSISFSRSAATLAARPSRRRWSRIGHRRTRAFRPRGSGGPRSAPR